MATQLENMRKRYNRVISQHNDLAEYSKMLNEIAPIEVDDYRAKLQNRLTNRNIKTGKVYARAELSTCYLYPTMKVDWVIVKGARILMLSNKAYSEFKNGKVIPAIRAKSEPFNPNGNMQGFTAYPSKKYDSNLDKRNDELASLMNQGLTEKEAKLKLDMVNNG